MRFLLRWQHLTPDTRLRASGRAPGDRAAAGLRGGGGGLGARAAGRARRATTAPSWLDELCLAGEVAWARLTPRKADGARGAEASADARRRRSRVTPVSLLPARRPRALLALARGDRSRRAPARGAAAEVYELLRDARRAVLRRDRQRDAPPALGRRARAARAGRRGLVTADGFQGLRQLSGSPNGRGRRRVARRGYAAGGFFAGERGPGRWALGAARRRDARPDDIDELAEAVAERAAAALRRGVPRPRAARELHGALARGAARAAPPGGARHGARRPLRLRLRAASSTRCRRRSTRCAACAARSATASASGSPPATR